MDDHIEVIQDDPSFAHPAIARSRAQRGIASQAVLDFVDDRAQMGRAGSGGDEEKVGYRREFVNIQNDDVFSFSVVCQFAAFEGQCF